MCLFIFMLVCTLTAGVGIWRAFSPSPAWYELSPRQQGELAYRNFQMNGKLWAVDQRFDEILMKYPFISKSDRKWLGSKTQKLARTGNP